eukprot:1160237-Pelagomonas_calceolata.AAC.9
MYNCLVELGGQIVDVQASCGCLAGQANWPGKERKKEPQQMRMSYRTGKSIKGPSWRAKSSFHHLHAQERFRAASDCIDVDLDFLLPNN